MVGKYERQYYRGLSIDGMKPVDGFLISCDYDNFIIPRNSTDVAYSAAHRTLKLNNVQKVYPETISISTCFKDTDRNILFEGDIIMIGQKIITMNLKDPECVKLCNSAEHDKIPIELLKHSYDDYEPSPFE